MNVKLIGALAVAAILAGICGYILILRADVAGLETQRAELTAEVARQEELVRNREARIAGLELTVGVRDQELSAVNQHAADVLDANNALRQRLWEIDEIIANSTPTSAKPGEITDENTNRAVVRHLNGMLPVVVRESTSATGNHRPAGGENIPVPQAGK